MNTPRPEYPRPDFMREHWLSLNGPWQFSFDEPTFDRSILVPFCYQSEASGIGERADHPTVWYRREFQVEKARLQGGRLLLHFGAVDYLARVWVNDVLVGEHRGGHTSFSLDITDAVTGGTNKLVVRAVDHCDTDKPRGKQSWTGGKFGCWYTPTTGIWQSVWLEYAGPAYLTRIKITPDVQRLQARCELFLSTHDEVEVELRATREGSGNEHPAQYDRGFLGQVTVPCRQGYGKAVLAFSDLDILRDDLLWSPEHPNLIDVTVTVRSKDGEDRVNTYFGLRDVGVQEDKLTLNHQFYYQRLVLDQGYWPDTLLTPPSDEAIVADIRLAKEMGFNGVRKHQKIEDPRFYYWADKLGLLVWGELPSAYHFNDNAVSNSSRELLEFLERDYNHPSIVAWVPMNESWGVRGVMADRQQQDYTRALYYLLRALDPMRPISSNDGWEQTGDTDICAIHDYALFPDTIKKYDDLQRLLASVPERRTLFAQGSAYGGQPVVMTEYGGISFVKDAQAGWGYYESAKDEADFLARLEPITTFLLRSGKFSGYCYTQLTDVMQEVNGLLTPDRKPKVPTEQLRAIFGGPLY